ncbi:MAG: DUF5112 domain-containing protein, partial [Bacteroidaceae bacterium]|nr:DUF5112 domain-containing protein [Bacteroidaceae bacterium]
MNRIAHLLAASLMAIVMLLSGCTFSAHRNETVERLNHRAFDFRYTNLDSVVHYAKLALAESEGYATGKSEAYNNMALASLMRQDFPTAEKYYSLSLKSSNNQLEHLISEVGMMRLCQRTASNKRFFDHYNKAARSISHLREEIDVLDKHDLGRLNVAESDYHLAASTHFYYMQQEDRARAELLKLD